MDFPTVSTTLGRVRGTLEDGLRVFRGIPYAQAPVGPGRWCAPATRQPWGGVRDAFEFAPSCPQLYQPGGNPIIGEHGSPPFDEDCLYLNVWTPSTDDASRPVLVWIHGGGFLTGSGAVPSYAGANFARSAGAVVVTLNYRIGAFGYLAGLGDDVNLWLADQAAALHWIAENAHQFGGDPEQIILMGQSGGGFSVGALLQHPQTRGLIKRAIVQSAPLGLELPDMEAAVERTRLLARALGHDRIEKLRDEPAERLVRGTLAVLQQLATFGEWSLAYLPVLDAGTMPRHPREVLAEADTDLLIGWTKDEASFAFGLDPRYAALTEEEVVAWLASRSDAPQRLYDSYDAAGAISPKEILIAAYSDGLFRRPAVEAVDARASNGLNTFVYEFVLESPAYDGALGSPHCFELPFTFANAERWGARTFLAGVDHETINSATEVMHGAWTAFVTSGSPDRTDREWPAYTGSQRAHAVLSSSSHVATEVLTPWRG